MYIRPGTLARRRYSWVHLLLIIALLAPAAAFSQTRTEKVRGRKAAAGEVLVKFRSAPGPDRLATITAENGLVTAKRIGSAGQLYHLRSRNKDVPHLMRRFAADPDVLYVEPNYVVHAVELPNDPSFVQLWGLQNTGQAVAGVPGTAGADISAVPAWGISTGSTANVVAVVDTGVDYTHPDLAANMWSSPSAFSVTIAGQVITCPAGSHGFNAITLSCDPMDDHFHGTHCAGTIGAVGNNSQGVVGVNWTTQIIGSKFLDATGAGFISDAVNAIEFLVQAKAAGVANVRVVSNSWGGGGFSQAFLDEINRANDMLFVFAAGNNGTNNDALPFYPASYVAPNLMAVAATDNNDQLAWFSNFGATSVHLGAPGVNIFSTTPGGTYQYLSGTSMATPHVSGAATLVLSRCSLDAAGLKADLVDSVDHTSALTGTTIAGGRLNAFAALSACNGPVSLKPASLVFPRLMMGGTSAPQTITVSNNQAQALAISSINASGDFAQTNTCGGGIAGFGSCTITVTFTPKSGGYLTGAVSMMDDASGSPQKAILSGMGVAPVSVEPAALDFDYVLVGTSSPALASRITNNTSAATAISSISISGDFTQTNDCPSSLGPAASCTLKVSFTPTASGSRSGTVTIVDGLGSQVLQLTGIGVTPPDLVEQIVSAPASAGTGQAVQITDTVLNQGGSDAPPSFTRYYLSKGTTKSGARLLSPSRVVDTVAAGASVTATTTVYMATNIAGGSYNLLACADDSNLIQEADETNNCASRAVQIVGPDLTEGGVTVSGTVGTGLTVQVADTVTNLGPGGAGGSVVRYYLSTTLSKSGARVLAGSRYLNPIDPGASDSGSVAVILPSNIALSAYYLLACADDTSQVPETNESNNCAGVPVQLQGPDLAEGTVSVAGVVATGLTVQVTDTVMNLGVGASGNSVVRYYLSTTLSKSGARMLTGSRYVNPVAPGASDSGTASVTLVTNIKPGAYNLLACADDASQVPETNESNNCAAAAVQVIGPDLIEGAVGVSGVVATGLAVQVTDRVTDQGVGAAGGSLVRYYLSTTLSKSGARLLSGSRYVNPVAPGASDTGTTSVTLSTNLPLGAYNLLACADDTLQVPETDETNNCAAVPVQVAGPDLVEGNVSVSGNLVPGQTVQIGDRVTDQGVGGAGNSVVRYYLSTTLSKSGARLLMGSRYVNPIAPGASDSGSAPVTVPSTVPLGAYNLLACADDTLQVPESNETNNCAATPVQVTAQ